MVIWSVIGYKMFSPNEPAPRSKARGFRPVLRFERMPFIPRFKTLGFSGMLYKSTIDQFKSLRKLVP